MPSRASRFNDEHCRCSRLCGSRVNCLEPCRSGSILVNRTAYDHAQRARWWGSVSLNSKAKSLRESWTGPTDESQRNLLGVVGPVATQDRCTSCWCRTHQTRTRSRRWFVHLVGSASTLAVRLSASKGEPRGRTAARTCHANWTCLCGSGDGSIEEARSLRHGSRVMPPC